MQDHRNKSKGHRGRPPLESAHYKGIAADLKARMAAGEFPVGSVLPALRRLADHYGVTKQTVTLAVNILKEEGRVATNQHRRLVARRPPGAATIASNIVLEILDEPLDNLSDYQCEIQRGIERGAAELDAPLLIVHRTHLRRAMPPDLFDLPLRGILLHGHLSRSVLRRYERLDFPIVFVDRPREQWRMHAVCVDNRNAAADATRRLVALGHRRIAFARYLLLESCEIDPDSKERQEGFNDAVHEAGLEAAAWRIFNVTSYDNRESAVLRSLLTAKPAFTAVFCSDGVVARNLLSTAQTLDRKVPRDLSIVCFDSIGKDSEFSGPRVDFQDMGVQSVRLLKVPTQPPLETRIPATWIEGRTVARPFTL